MREITIQFESIAELAEVFTTELSHHRVFLPATHKVREREELQLRLQLPETRSVLSAEGIVLALRTEGPRGPGADVVLVDFPASTLELIQEFITERLNASAFESAREELVPLNVLIVDDSPTYQQLAASAFVRAGDHVRFASDGFEALASALRERPDVLISDVTMPKLDGWQLLRIVRANPKLASIPVVFTTALSGERERLRGYQLGVDDYVAKPFRATELRARVERLVRRAKTEPAPALTRSTIRGDLAQVSLPSVLSLLELEQRDGTLAIEGSPSGTLWISRGRVLRAEVTPSAGKSSARSAAFALLGAREGEFQFNAETIEGPDELQLSITALLLEHAQSSDEAAR